MKWSLAEMRVQTSRFGIVGIDVGRVRIGQLVILEDFNVQLVHMTLT